jgi:hypothetical protein
MLNDFYGLNPAGKIVVRIIKRRVFFPGFMEEKQGFELCFLSPPLRFTCGIMGNQGAVGVDG